MDGCARQFTHGAGAGRVLSGAFCQAQAEAGGDGKFVSMDAESVRTTAPGLAGARVNERAGRRVSLACQASKRTARATTRRRVWTGTRRELTGQAQHARDQARPRVVQASRGDHDGVWWWKSKGKEGRGLPWKSRTTSTRCPDALAIT